ncbi:coat protein [Rubus virus 1]|uniref:Capsid protein n=1 Tax=Rubus virus 1 TaxID=2754817 RepID=A0AAE7G3T8_9VIRU|nr:coat protein [Rubus virus 1]QLI58029.1 coat protein [Rubus virus 1]
MASTGTPVITDAKVPAAGTGAQNVSTPVGSGGIAQGANNPKRETLRERLARRKAASKGGFGHIPDVKEPLSFDYEPETRAVVTADQRESIEALFKEIGVGPDNILKAAVDLCRQGVDVSTSPDSIFSGVSSAQGDVKRETLMTSVREVTSARAFCRYFARHVWNKMLEDDTPPANWAAKGFKEGNKFAAWDCFDYVMSPAVAQAHIKREPTAEEMAASIMGKEVFVFRQASKQGTQSLNVGEITGGKSGPKPKITIKQ